VKKLLSIFLFTLAITGTCWSMKRKRNPQKQEKLDKNLIRTLKAKIDDVGCIKYFLKKGANPNCKIDNMTPLKAARGLDTSIIRQLLLHGAKIKTKEEFIYTTGPYLTYSFNRTSDNRFIVSDCDMKTILKYGISPQENLILYHKWKAVKIGTIPKKELLISEKISLDEDILMDEKFFDGPFLPFLKAALKAHRNFTYHKGDIKRLNKALKKIAKKENERSNYAIQNTNQKQVQKTKIIVNGQDLTIFKTLLC